MRKEFPKRHKQLWLWLSDNPFRYKLDCPIWEEILPHDIPTNYCFACEEAITRYNTIKNDTFMLYCYHCPIHYMLPGDDTACLGGLYAKYTLTVDLKIRSLLALKIANLPWR